MKFAISLFLVAVVNHQVTCADINMPGHNVASEKIGHLPRVITRDVEFPFPIPIEDTYGFDHVELSMPGEIFSANVNITKGSITGVSRFRLLELNLSETDPMIGINILFPLLTLHAENYELDGNIYYAVPLKGQGVALIEIQNLQICGTVYMKQSTISNAVLFDKLVDAELHVERIVSRTEFDHNIDDIISALVEDLLADYINRFNKYVIATYSDTVIQYINNIIEAQ